MRHALPVVLIASLAALPPAEGQKAAKAPRENVLTDWLDAADIHPPVAVGALTVFPVSVRDRPRLGGLLTLDEALRKELLVIEELPDAQVGRARFINRSGERMIFLMAGEVITGGKQNRTLTTDALLAPDSTTVLDLYCVQKGRWKGRRKFAPANTIAPQAVREKAAQKAGQNAVWSEVARANRRMGVVSPSGDLGAAMTSPDNLKRLTALRRRVVAKLPERAAGVVVACGRQIVGADLFNSDDLFSAMRRKVLDSYLSQFALGDAEDARPGDAPGQKDVQAYLQACYRARFTPGPMRGVGRIHHVRGARHGETLAYARPVRAPTKSRKPAPVRRHMVHTALMRRVLPVRPGPVPVPRPGPPPRRMPHRNR